MGKHLVSPSYMPTQDIPTHDVHPIHTATYYTPALRTCVCVCARARARVVCVCARASLCVQDCDTGLCSLKRPSWSLCSRGLCIPASLAWHRGRTHAPRTGGKERGRRQEAVQRAGGGATGQEAVQRGRRRCNGAGGGGTGSSRTEANKQTNKQTKKRKKERTSLAYRGQAAAAAGRDYSRE
jgi:hypothetical protein